MAGVTIGVFDSGFGGLTVMRALLPLVPGARFIYLGDTARLPYGDKSKATIVRYALSSAAFLLAQGADLLVVACNTASALALKEMQAALPIPVVGVIEPGVAAARILTPAPPAGFVHELSGPDKSCSVLVMATAATVQSHAYAAACSALGLRAYEKACPLLVPLVEEGWIDSPARGTVTEAVLSIYLTEALAEAPRARTLVLGCTHYPLLQPLIERVLLSLGHPLEIVDSAAATAQAARALLPAGAGGNFTRTMFYATDSVEKFARLGSAFLGQPLGEVHLLDLGG
jgi:glutamate racemase